MLSKSTVPYSSVESTAVYNGNRKKVINCVHIFPTVIIKVFFTNLDSLLIFLL